MLGISYLGGCHSAKLKKSMEQNIYTYGLYLAPNNISGYNVCPESRECKKYCLNGSGMNKLELLSSKSISRIQDARIKRTKLFFENREFFMQLLVSEINTAKILAQNQGLKLAIRLNCTSDINIEKFKLSGKNILEIFPEEQFYDYTKVYSYMAFSEKYKNYDLTFSYNGTNWAQCETLLNQNRRVAVVFEDTLPKFYKGFPVINGNETDTRFLDDDGVVCGLTYKKVANDYKNGKYQSPHSKFVVQKENELCTWEV